MLKKMLRVVLLFLCITPLSFSQQDTLNYENDDVVEDLIQEHTEETDNAELIDEIEYLIDNPVNLNKADIFELQQIPYLNFNDAQKIIEYRSRFGNIFSKNELYTVKGLDVDLVNKILPFVTTELTLENNAINRTSLKQRSIQFETRNRIINNLQNKTGFIENKFPGSRYKTYSRSKIKYGDNYNLGYLIEKDAGEKSFDDFSSFYFSLNNMGKLKKLVVGDYILESGQGLALWSPYALLKGSEVTSTVKRKGKEIKPYTSTDENAFFRGTAASIKLNPLIISLFYSKNKFDAYIDTSSRFILSTPKDGLHRTAGEVNRKKTASETLFGAMMNYQFSNYAKIGLLYFNSRFSKIFFSTNLFEINGGNFNYYAINYDLSFSTLNVFGEAAYSGISVASITNLQIAVNKNFQFITSIRSYPHNYIAIHGNGFRERSSAVQNEVGIYNGIKIKSIYGTIDFYYDQFKFPYSDITNPLPVQGNEFLLNYNFSPINKLNVNFKTKFEKKEISKIIAGTAAVVKRIKHSYRSNIVFNISKQIRLKGRFEYNKYSVTQLKVEEEGIMFFQDVRFKMKDILQIYTRFIFFKTASFLSAIYEYENDINGIFSNVPLYGQGLRWYILIKYQPLKHIIISIKYSETYKPDEKYIGTGNAKIDGNIDNRVSLQIDMKF